MIRPWYRAPSTRSDLVRTESAPMIEAMIATPPITSGKIATSREKSPPEPVKVRTPSSITATEVTA